jgi:hypothetical protein
MVTFWIIACFATLIAVAVITFDSGPIIDDDLTDAFAFEERQETLSNIIEGKDKR